MENKVDQPSELKVTLALGTTLIIQTAVALLWAGAASERLAQIERRVDTTSQIVERTARLEEQVVYVRASLERIEKKLDAGGD